MNPPDNGDKEGRRTLNIIPGASSTAYEINFIEVDTLRGLAGYVVSGPSKPA